MNHFKHKITVYLPLLFALVLLAGIMLGMRLTPGSSGDQRIFSIDLSGYDKVSDIISFIAHDYVDTVNVDEIQDEAIVELLKNLDPHSQYIPASEFDEVNEPLKGNFEGIGVQFRIEKDTVMVVLPISGGPSERVGIKAGDRIVIVDGDTIAGIGINNDEVMKRLKGPRNTKVEVGIVRRNTPGILDFTIKRDVIPTYSLDIAYMVNDSVGYIKLNKFSATTAKEMRKALRELNDRGMKELIFDLRGNAGGYLQAAIDVADEFLKNGKLIVYTEGKNRPRDYAYATDRGSFEEGRLIVLIDEGSASASEIVAGAIQDNDRGIIMGRRSFGKGLVQEQMNLNDGSALRLTVARYYTPTGRCIQKSYANGTEEYYKEFHDRFINGEVQHADSIHFDDSLKFVTPGGKVVYGGGGIMPDVFVPVEMDDHLAYYNRLINRGIIYDYAFEYTDAHRDKLSEYKNPENFDRHFSITDTIFSGLIEYAAENGVEKNEGDIQARKDDIKILLKALIARNVFDNDGFYPIYHRKDDTFQQALKMMNEGTRER
jgi:carboxyl-terminal processing protease